MAEVAFIRNRTALAQYSGGEILVRKVTSIIQTYTWKLQYHI